MPPAIPIFALMNRGLESISAAEIAALPHTQVTQIGYRRVEADSSELSSLLTLRTIDDVFLKLATWHDVGHERRWLALFTQLGEQLTTDAFLPLLADLRSIPQPPRFSVTVNFVGKRNYSAPEVKTAIADGINRQQPAWQYVEDDRDADLNLRVFIDHQTALVGLRIGATPLHRRAYKVFHQPGALKPTVAAAMVRLADIQPGALVIDPFCGSGTIVVEAALSGAAAIGGDLDVDATQGALLNSQQVLSLIYQGDARRIPLPDGSVDAVISNLPWGRQVQVDDRLMHLYQQSFAEMQRVIKPAGKIVLLTTFPDLLDATPDEAHEISLFGQTPQILIFSAGN